MKKIITGSLTVVAIVSVALLLGCQELGTSNLAAPDESRALATPSDIESLIKGAFLNWYEGSEDQFPAMALAVQNDTYACTWGNFGMSALSQLPRVAIDNSTTAGDLTRSMEEAWFGQYGAISAASDGIRILTADPSEGGIRLATESDTQRAITFATLVQGLAHGFLAMVYDQGFVLDENSDLINAPPELQPYTEVMAAAIAFLEKTIVLANASTFTTPLDWINGRGFSNMEIAQIAHSYIARYKLAVARDAAERAAIDWAGAVSHANMGITSDFQILGDGGGRGGSWYNATQWYASIPSTWIRADMRLIGPSDVSGAYETWLALPTAQKTDIEIESSDARIWDGTRTDGAQNPGSEFSYFGQSPNWGARFSYRNSPYAHDRFTTYQSADAADQITLFRVSEFDFLKAEALLWGGGGDAEIAALLDKTHVVKGGYPTTAGLARGSVSDGVNPRHDNGATLWSVFQYERNLELVGTSSGLQYTDQRSWSNLPAGTPLHWPVPAKDLQTLQLDIYTHGAGVGRYATKVPANAFPTPFAGQ